ncbi:MAG: tRNA (adenosine(37)-N6)-dimethylallyltransferase MiaA [Candidatus Ancillula sp.]|jgi:tRNA dimethylallyltransferase|nr:tRNA (adenosine(37)-N6)-dimethylallyltransferase MiaA [Candidatus Ancillula sp.]
MPRPFIYLVKLLSSQLLSSALELVELRSPRIIAIVGPTATGKSDLAISLAKALKERGVSKGDATQKVLPQIINADSYARYRKMDIGTAKVDLQTRLDLERQWGVKHYQIDVLDPSETSTAQSFAECVKIEIDDISQNANSTLGVPILCGGSGLYVRSVLDGFEFQKQDVALRKSLESRLECEGVHALYMALREKSPETAAHISPQNARRVIRALESLELQGTHIATLPQYTYAYPSTLQIGLETTREELDRRIDIRTSKMRELGLVSEVSALYSSQMLGETAIKAIGYAEVVSFLNSGTHPGNGRKLDLDATFELIATHTKRLVRRQLSWFKRDPRIHWLKA